MRAIVLPNGCPYLECTGVGLDCCYAGVRFLKDIAHAKLLVDPFCGRGTMIAMANTLGMSSMGIEISKRRCGRALLLDLSGKLHLLSKAISKINTGVDYKNTLDETINIPKAVRKAVAARAAADRIQYELVAMRVADDEPKCEQDERDSTTSI